MNGDYLRSILSYSPDTGVFIWKKDKGPAVKEGDVAGRLNKGYVQIGIDGKRYDAQRLAFLYMTEELPDRQVDHINGIRNDNRWRNLRQATAVENGQNRTINKNNTSGYAGVSFRSKNKRFIARIRIPNKQIYLGSFTTAEEAYQAYSTAKLELHKFSPEVR
jgi:hypothetical protein